MRTREGSTDALQMGTEERGSRKHCRRVRRRAPSDGPGGAFERDHGGGPEQRTIVPHTRGNKEAAHRPLPARPTFFSKHIKNLPGGVF